MASSKRKTLTPQEISDLNHAKSEKDFNEKMKKEFGHELTPTDEKSQAGKYLEKKFQLEEQSRLPGNLERKHQFGTLNADEYKREIHQLFNDEFRKESHLPDDIRNKLNDLKAKLITDKKIELAQINRLVLHLANAVKDLSHTKEIIDIINMYMENNDFSELLLNLNKPGGLTEQGKQFTSGVGVKKDVWQETFLQKMQNKISLDGAKKGAWNTQLEEIAKKVDPTLTDFVNITLADMYQTWEMQTNQIINSSQSYTSKLFGTEIESRFNELTSRYKILVSRLKQAMQTKTTSISEIYKKIITDLNTHQASSGIPDVYARTQERAEQFAKLTAERQKDQKANEAISRPSIPGKSR